MQALRIDTLEFSKRLEAAGVKHDQAVAHTQVYADMLHAVVDSEVAKKQDLNEAEQRINEKIQSNKEQIQNVHHELDSKIKDVQIELGEIKSYMKNQTLRLIVSLGSMIAVATGVLALVIKVA